MEGAFTENIMDVLYVDDHDLYRYAMAHDLKLKMHYSMVTPAQTREILSRLASYGKYSLVIINAHTAGILKAWACIEAIRTHERFRELPILFISDHNVETDYPVLFDRKTFWFPNTGTSNGLCTMLANEIEPLVR